MNSRKNLMRPCIKCGVVDRDVRGNCAACARSIVLAWRSKNKDRLHAQAVARYAAMDKEKAAGIRAARYASNMCHEKAGVAAWQAANIGAKRIHDQNRRARIKMVGGSLSKGLSGKLFALQKGKCPCCNLPLGEKFHLDHILPLFLGGTNTDDNIQLLRQQCNNQKHAKHPVDFMQQKGFLI